MCPGIFTVLWEAEDMLNLIQVENPKRIGKVLTQFGLEACENRGTCLSKHLAFSRWDKSVASRQIRASIQQLK